MKKNYQELSLLIVIFSDEDVVRTSQSFDIGENEWVGEDKEW